jgi:two-component system cell cycle response regulator DivK
MAHQGGRINRRTNMANELILIVEDNEKNRKLERDILHFKGYQLLEAETAEEGIQLAREKMPALILMDFQLPGMNGIDAFKILRADPQTKSIPIIAVTASAMSEDRKRMIDAGFDGLETKPINVKEFLATVAATLKKFAGIA